MTPETPDLDNHCTGTQFIRSQQLKVLDQTSSSRSVLVVKSCTSVSFLCTLTFLSPCLHLTRLLHRCQHCPEYPDSLCIRKAPSTLLTSPPSSSPSLTSSADVAQRNPRAHSKLHSSLHLQFPKYLLDIHPNGFQNLR